MNYIPYVQKGPYLNYTGDTMQPKMEQQKVRKGRAQILKVEVLYGTDISILNIG